MLPMSTMPAPAGSVLTPTRDRCTTYLPMAIASVRASRLSRTSEHVVIDDGSSDGTPDFLRAEAATDPYLRWQSQPAPMGVAAARNRALALARGTFVVDLDDDDLVTVDGIEHRLRYLRSHPDTWAVHANALKIDAEGRVSDWRGRDQLRLHRSRSMRRALLHERDDSQR